MQVPEHLRSTPYVSVLLAVVFVASLVAAVGIWRGAKGWGWTLGAVVSVAAAVAFPLSRLVALPGFAEAVGAWHDPLAGISLLLEGAYLAGWFTVVTGISVAAPRKRHWHD